MVELEIRRMMCSNIFADALYCLNDRKAKVCLSNSPNIFCISVTPVFKIASMSYCTYAAKSLSASLNKAENGLVRLCRIKFRFG